MLLRKIEKQFSSLADLNENRARYMPTLYCFVTACNFFQTL